MTDNRLRRGVLWRWITGAHGALTPLRPPRSQARSSLQLGVLLAGSGGFLDAFTYVGHGHVFANGMTGNVVLCGRGRTDHAARRQALCFGVICLAFLAGATLGAVTTPPLGNGALWVADLLLGAGMLLFLIEKRQAEESG